MLEIIKDSHSSHAQRRQGHTCFPTALEEMVVPRQVAGNSTDSDINGRASNATRSGMTARAAPRA